MTKSPILRLTDFFEDNRPLVLYTGLIGLPGSGAAIEHALNVAKTLEAGGFRVILLPWTNDARPEDHLRNGLFLFQGIHYIPVGNPATNGASRLQSLRVFTGTRAPILDFLKTADLTAVAAIITMEGSAGYSWKLRSLCKSRRIGVIAEVTEHYATNMPGQSFSQIQRVDMAARIQMVYPKYDGIIAITTYLEGYYARKGCKVFRLPPVLDTQESRWKFPAIRAIAPPGSLRLVFLGAPVRDRHELILEAILQMRKDGFDITLGYVGSSRQLMESLLGERQRLLLELGDAVVFHGRVKECHLKEILMAADFGVLLREDARWSRCCFPSRVPEFLALGVPILCNETSDLAEHLRDGSEALIVPDLSVDSVKATLARGASLTETQRARMRSNARLLAESSFDIRPYIRPLESFIQQTAEKARQNK